MDVKNVKGRKITSLDELLKLDKVWIDIPSWTSHVRSAGYVKSLQLNMICKFMMIGLFYTVEPKKNEELVAETKSFQEDLESQVGKEMNYDIHPSSNQAEVVRQDCVR